MVDTAVLTRAYQENELRKAGCVVHGDHHPRMASGDLHHIWPEGMGGPDIPENWVFLCPTGHRNVHSLLAWFIRSGGFPTWDVLRRYHPNERKLALHGYIAQLAGKL